MASEDNSGARPAGPVVLRIKLRYDDLDAMVQRFAPNVGKSGLFLPTKSIQPIGTEVKFELRLANDVAVLVGQGRVKHVKPPDPKNPKAAFGMAIELMRVSREGREVIIRMIERRRAMGLPDVAIPIPEDAEAARRAEVETQPRTEPSNVARDALTSLAKHEAPSGALLTSPRPGSGPIAIAREQQSSRVPVPSLAPEKSRPRRPAVQELIDRAAELSSRIVLPTPELDMHVDVERVLTRARALAGGDLDVELATLREAAAAPIEISVEAASAELARQLGGKPINKRDKSARWAPPPAIELKTPIAELDNALPKLRSEPAEPAREEFVAKTRAETELAPSATIAEAVSAAIEAQIETPSPDSERDVITAVTATIEPSELRAQSPSVVPEESYVIRQSAELVAQRDADDYDDDAFLQNPSTTTAVEPQDIDPDTVPPSFGVANEVKTDPADQRGLMIDDDADISSFERALDAARIHTGVSKVAPPRPDEDEDDDDGPAADLLASGEYQLDEPAASESTVISVAPLPRLEAPPIPDQLAAQLDQQLAEAEAEANGDMAELREEEISDLDVLAEADEEDEDLLQTPQPDYAEQFATPHGYDEPLAEAEPQVAPYAVPIDDFAARLDLGDDDDELPPAPDIDRDAAREFDEDVPQPIHDYSHVPERDSYREPDYREPPESYREPPESYAYQRAKRASSEQSYTFAEDPPQSLPHFAPHESGEEFDEPHSYSAEPGSSRGPDPRLLRHGRPTTASTDLEDALAALDVGGIDLEGQRRTRRPTPSSSRPLPGLPIERPRTGPVPVVDPAPATNPPRVAHTVPRSAVRTTGQQAIQPQPQPQLLGKPPTGQVPVVEPQRAKPPTGQQPAPPRPKSSTAKPPPIPLAARKPPTMQVPITRPPAQQAPVVQPAKRAPTDEGVLIDFDEDE